MTRPTRGPWWAEIGVRFRFVAAPAPPLTIELSGGTVVVTYADLVKHAGGGEVGAVVCTSRTFTSVEVGGARMPELWHLYTGRPAHFTLWPGDALRFNPVKPGGVELVALLVLSEA